MALKGALPLPVRPSAHLWHEASTLLFVDLSMTPSPPQAHTSNDEEWLLLLDTASMIACSMQAHAAVP